MGAVVSRDSHHCRHGIGTSSCIGRGNGRVHAGPVLVTVPLTVMTTSDIATTIPIMIIVIIIPIPIEQGRGASGQLGDLGEVQCNHQHHHAHAHRRRDNHYRDLPSNQIPAKQQHKEGRQIGR